MAHSDDLSPSEKTLSGPAPAAGSTTEAEIAEVAFLPDEMLNEAALREALETAPRERRLELVAHIVSYAPWDEIWNYLSRQELAEILPELELPESLAAAWQRFLHS